MKNDLTCGVVRDLLPSYVEGLTSEETNRAVEAHLSTCPDCTARKNAMTVPTEPSEDAEQGREVDYLKTVKRKSGRRVVIAIACTLAVILAGVALKLFVIGEPAGREGMSWSIRCDETAMDLRVYSTWSGVAYCRWDLENSDGVVRLTAKKVLPSFLYDSADHRERIPLEDVREVWIAEQLIWQDGLMLEQDTMALYETKTPYMGDAPALERVAEALGVRRKLGNYTNSLHTSSRPYDWTLEFSAPMMEGRSYRTDSRMETRAVIMLALVENLDQVTWTYTDAAGVFHSQTVTAEDAVRLLREQFSAFTDEEATSYGLLLLDDIKDYAGTPANFQRLLNTICYDPIND